MIRQIFHVSVAAILIFYTLYCFSVLDAFCEIFGKVRECIEIFYVSMVDILDLYTLYCFEVIDFFLFPIPKTLGVDTKIYILDELFYMF